MATCSERSAWPTSPSPASFAMGPTRASFPTRALAEDSALRRAGSAPSGLSAAPPAGNDPAIATIEGRRQALLDAGARLTAETYGQREPRKGVMRL